MTARIENGRMRREAYGLIILILLMVLVVVVPTTAAGGELVPLVAAVNPDLGTRGMSVDLIITGTDFLSGAVVTLRKTGSPDIPATVLAVGPTSISCTLTIPSDAAIGSRDVVVVNPNGLSGTLESGFTIIPPSPPPVVTSVSPDTGTAGSTVENVKIMGFGFQAGAKAALWTIIQVPPGIPRPVFVSFSVLSVTPDQILCSIAIPLSAKPTTYYLSVTNPDGQSGALESAFVITPPSPSPVVTSVSPNNGIRGTTVTGVVISGMGFSSGAAVKLASPGQPDITAEVSEVTPTAITCDIAIPEGTALAKWDVVVVNPDGQAGTLESGFLVTPPLPPPVVTSVSPDTGTAGSTVENVKITGFGFQAGATAELRRILMIDPSTGKPIFYVLPVTVVSVTDDQILGSVTIPLSAPSGAYSLVVTNPDGQSGSIDNVFSITWPKPVITGVSPDTGIAGSTVENVKITGIGFQTGATAELWTEMRIYPTPNPIRVSLPFTVLSVTPDQILGSLAIPPFYNTWTWNLSVTNPDGQLGSIDNRFTITRPPPAVTSVSPSSAYVGSTVKELKIVGSGFQAGATAELTRYLLSPYPNPPIRLSIPVTVSSITPDQIFGSIIIPTNTLWGEWDLVVKNPDGQSGSIDNIFTIIRPPPAVTSVSPSSAYVGSTVKELKIAGSGFQAGAEAWIWKFIVHTPYQQPTKNISVTVTSLTPDQILGSITIPFTDVDQGTWNLVVENPDGQSGSIDNILTITRPPPAVTSASPSSVYVGSTVKEWKIVGSGFQTGATVGLRLLDYINPLSGAPVYDFLPVTVSFVTSNQILASVTIPFSADPGAWELVVVNPDGQNTVKTNAFTIRGLPTPHVTSVTPKVGYQGMTSTLTVYGSGFWTGAKVNLARPSHSDIPCTVTSLTTTRIGCTFKIPSKAETGVWNVLVTNPDGQVAKKSNGFYVFWHW